MRLAPQRPTSATRPLKLETLVDRAVFLRGLFVAALLARFLLAAFLRRRVLREHRYCAEQEGQAQGQHHQLLHRMNSPYEPNFHNSSGVYVLNRTLTPC